MAVLKAGAYGHGIEQIAHALEQEEIAFFGVASVIEARKVAQSGCSTRLYLLGPTFPEEREEIVVNRWTPCISTLEEAEHFNELNQGEERLPVHLTVDTGMGRGGFLPEQISTALPQLLSLLHISLEGIGSHLPSADEDREFTLKQFAQFKDIVTACKKHGEFKFIHLANSAGLLDYTSSQTNLVRPGLMLYGISPIANKQDLLKPVMSLNSRVSLIRTLPKGHGISYGRATILKRDTKVATVGIGYGDGYPRRLSGTGAEVFINGQRCPLLGRVTMDQIMIDVSDLPDCQPGDLVELYGENILVSELAAKADTIPWAILTGITPRVTRLYQG